MASRSPWTRFRTGWGRVVLADAAQLHRAILNLVSNAVKFSRTGGDVQLYVDASEGRPSSRSSTRGSASRRRTSPGLGSRFYRASNAMKAEIAGTGLGLRIVETIVRDRHGNLTVDSVEGEGTTATIRLPLSRPVRRLPGSPDGSAALAGV